MNERLEITHFLEHILVKKHGVKQKNINLHSKIPTELGVDGADAVEFLADVERHFEVKLGINFDDHFWPESGLFFSQNIHPLSIDQLVERILQALAQKSIDQ